MNRPLRPLLLALTLTLLGACGKTAGGQDPGGSDPGSRATVRFSLKAVR